MNKTVKQTEEQQLNNFFKTFAKALFASKKPYIDFEIEYNGINFGKIGILLWSNENKTTYGKRRVGVRYGSIGIGEDTEFSKRFDEFMNNKFKKMLDKHLTNSKECHCFYLNNEIEAENVLFANLSA